MATRSSAKKRSAKAKTNACCVPVCGPTTCGTPAKAQVRFRAMEGKRGKKTDRGCGSDVCS